MCCQVQLSDAPSQAQVRAAAAAALAAAAVKARLMADAEERELQRLAAAAVELQARKVDLKLRHLDELEQVRTLLLSADLHRSVASCACHAATVRLRCSTNNPRVAQQSLRILLQVYV